MFMSAMVQIFSGGERWNLKISGEKIADDPGYLL
jgi:hypothetical protein